MNLFEELKRRRVFRVAGAYIVGAWIVLQAADVLFPALHLPPWTVTLVAVVVIIGFPVALLLGWAFDITPGGVERAAPTAGTLRFPARAAMVGTVLVALGVGGFVTVRRRAVAAKLDMNAVVVLPFRVAGDASLEVMREGMVDLLSAKLTGEVGPRAIDSRTTLSAWRREIADEKDDLPAADAVHLARSLGAGQVLLGEVVGTPGKVAVTATLYSSVDGGKITRAEDVASPDSVLQLVDRIVAKLLSQQAGEGHRTEALVSESLTAVKAYLDAQRLYRKGEYTAAETRYRAALDEDSTFALAGLGLSLVRSWGGYGDDWVRGRDIAWRHRDRLPQWDREYVMALLGENHPRATPTQARIARWRGLLQRAPDRIEAWYELGDVIYHTGSIIGIEDPEAEALEAWGQVLVRDSTFMPALEHQIDILASRGDTASLRRVASLLYSRIQPDLKYKTRGAWLIATALADETWLKELRKHVGELSADRIRYVFRDIIVRGLPQTDVPFLIDAALQAANTPEEKVTVIREAGETLLNIGKPAAALTILDRIKQTQSDAAYHATVVLLGTQYSELDSVAVAKGMPFVEKQMATGVSLGFLLAPPLLRCMLADHALQQRSTNLLTMAASLRADAAASIGQADGVVGQVDGTLLLCAGMLEAGARILSRAPDARTALQRVDSTVVNGLEGWRSLMALTVTKLHLEQGDIASAYNASLRTRRELQFGLAPLLLERGRLAARLGKRDAAIGWYRSYLKMRPDPEPGPASELVAKATNELNALVGERAR